MSKKRKLQVSNGHYLEFDQLSRLIHTILDTGSEQKVTMSFLEEESGLPFRQVRNRVSIGRAMGVFAEKSLSLTSFGKLVAEYDTFFESKGTLEYIHYLAASEFKNLLWFEVFNTFLTTIDPLNYQGWLQHFRTILADQYSDHSLKDHLGKEVRFLIQAYTGNSFAKLELLYKDADDRLCPRRYLEPTLMTFSAMLYDFSAKQHTNLLQMDDLLESPGSPGRLFFLGREVLSSTVESLHDHGYIRYERTHNLNQIRLREEYSALVFLRAYYQGEEPEATVNRVET